LHNRHLDAFITIADVGSITKAAQKMYVSNTALNKQIQLLEQHIGVKLFERSVKGVVLTKAGRFVYEGAKDIVSRSDYICKKAREIASDNEYIIKLGTSLINNASILFDYNNEFTKLHPNINIIIIPDLDGKGEYQSLLKHLGRDIDILLRPTALPQGERFRKLTLMKLQTEIILSRKHRLSSKKLLSIEDMYGENIIMLKRGVAYDSDEIRDLFETKHPQINIIDVDRYTQDSFDKLMTDHYLLIGSSRWLDMHPMLTALPVDWDFGIPYGIVFAEEPSYAVTLYVNYLKERLCS
jgi:DNA-binding transcriptional LysR family regulator